LLEQGIKRTEGSVRIAAGYMQILHRGLNAGMTQQLFDRNDIKTIFQQMGSECMTESMSNFPKSKQKQNIATITQSV